MKRSLKMLLSGLLGLLLANSATMAHAQFNLGRFGKQVGNAVQSSRGNSGSKFQSSGNNSSQCLPGGFSNKRGPAFSGLISGLGGSSGSSNFAGNFNTAQPAVMPDNYGSPSNASGGPGISFGSNASGIGLGPNGPQATFGGNNSKVTLDSQGGVGIGLETKQGTGIGIGVNGGTGEGIGSNGSGIGYGEAGGVGIGTGMHADTN